MTSAARHALRSVRVRITLIATVVTGLAVLLAGTWLVRTVEGSLRSDVRTEVESRLDRARAAIVAGRAPARVDLDAVTDHGGYLQIVIDGRVVAASPAIAGLPPLSSLPADGDEIDVEGVPMAVSHVRVDGRTGSIELFAAYPVDPVRGSVDAVKDGLLVAFPLLVGAVGLLSWVLAGRALRPVESIRAEVEAITGSTLDRRVPEPTSGDEVARLAQTMNAMLDRLQDASTRQQRFVADASHELRSPVAAIRTELEVAQLTAGPEDWPAIAARLLAEEARLEAVIADLLLLASLDEGAALPEAVLVDLAEEAVEEVRRRTSAEDPIRVAVDAPVPVLVLGNRLQLRRALTNLLDNACRHARASVQVSVRARDARARVLVDDDGDGIPEADRQRVFERFTRLDDARTRAIGGAGLGLSLVRRIADVHAGTASVDTSPLGGARLVLELPVAPAPVAPRQASRADTEPSAAETSTVV